MHYNILQIKQSAVYYISVHIRIATGFKNIITAFVSRSFLSRHDCYCSDSWNRVVGQVHFINPQWDLQVYIFYMKISAFIAFLLLFASARADPLQLFSVSTSPSAKVLAKGGVRGGTTIYISGVGFNANAAGNQIFVGTYPCIIPAAGATQTTLACVTSDTGQTGNIYNLPITVISNGQQQQLTNQQGSFSYLSNLSPVIYALYPASAVSGSYVNFYGVHRITRLGDGLRDMGDIISMLIGNYQCGRFDILQGPLANGDALDTVSCNSAQLQEAGKYSVTEWVVPGYSMPSYLLRRASFLNENYHYAVLPGINNISPNSGAVAGQKITITGSGFSANSSIVAVSVDNNACDVVSSSLTQIVCNLRNRNISLTSKLATNSANQTNGYFSGAGLRYRRYDISKLSQQNLAGLRAAINSNSSQLTLVQSGYRGEIKTGNYYGTYYGQAFTGYFTAPVDGAYTFQGTADDAFAVYLSSSFGSADPNASPLIYSNYHQNPNFYLTYVATAEGTVTLQAGKSYYIEVYHINYGGSGALKVSVQVPNTDQTLTWQTHAVHRLELNYTNDPEVVQFNQSGGTGGQINLTVSIRVIGQAPVVQAALINYNASQAEFQNALNQLSCFGPFQISVTTAFYDSAGNPTTNASQIYTYSWIVSVRLLRTSASISAKIVPVYLNYSGAKNFTYAITHNHGPLLSGTFGLTLNGSPLLYFNSNGLPATIFTGWLQVAIRAVPGFSNTQVDLISDGSYQAYGSVWIITFYGVNGVVPPIIADGTNLLGGVAGTLPQVFTSVIRNYSPNLLFDPIDFNLLSTDSSGINVLVTVNSLPSVCVGSCSYSFLTNTPVLTSNSISNSVLTLSLTDPALINYTLLDTTVALGNQPCTINNAATTSISNFTCSLPNNPDNTPTIQAGTYTPVVTVAQVGTVPYGPAVVPFNFPLVLTSLNITSGGTNGGYALHLVGKGFPTTLTDATVTICGVNATLTAVDNINAYIIVPPCATGSTNVFISSPTQASNSLTFNYAVPTPIGYIFTVTPQSYNPSLKGIMVITGVGFGSDQSAIRVDLSNSTGKVYRMRILNLNDTYIKVGIPGGLAGKFKVQVNRIGLGEIMPNSSACNDFTYELVINSVTPTSGSYNGGTLIHVQGINFSPALDETLVFVGNAINWFCAVESLNTTDILCRTPAFNANYNLALPQPVILENRLMVDNTCGGSCDFSYLASSSSPSLTTISPSTISSGTITLVGTNLDLIASKPVIVVQNVDTGAISTVAAATANATTLTFTLPKVESGYYNVRARLDPIGQTNNLQLSVSLAASAATPATLSLNGGRVVLTGSGLPASWPNSNFALTITSGSTVVAPNVFDASPSGLTLLLPASSSDFTISVISPLNGKIALKVAVSSSNTPNLTLSSASSVAAGNNALTFTKNNLQAATPLYVEVYSLFNSNQVYNITIPAQTSNTSVVFSIQLPGGLFAFRFYYASYGYAACDSQLAVTISQPTIPNFVASYNGATVTVSGSGLSPSATVTVNGFKGQLSKISSIDATASIPAFISAATQTQYNLASPQKLSSSQFSVIADTISSSSQAFDGLYSTVYSSTSQSTCFVGIDVGSQLSLNLTRVRYFPNSKWLTAASYLVGATFEGSNDGTNYDVVASVDSTVHTGWNIIQTDLTKVYRYFRFAHNQVSACQLAELEFTGILLSNNNPAALGSTSASLVYQDGANTFSYSNIVEFRQDRTPIVNTLSQTTGDVFGGYLITLNGNYLNFSTPSIAIDGQICVVTSTAATAVTCNVSSRYNLPSKNSFVVTVGNNNAVIYQQFSYVLRWSDIRTWGTDMPPVDGDLVFVPIGMNLLVDVSTPLLKGILVQNGTLTFADQSDMLIRAGFISVVGGRLIAGTEDKPYQHQLTFQMYGDYYGAQAPMFGNKGIGCMECYLSLHGKPRAVTWTSLATSAAAGANSITVQDTVDWKVGEEIVVASSNFDHNQAQRRTITGVSGNTVSLNQSLNYLHFSGVENYGTDQVEMRAEVGLLSRNIKVTGDASSQQKSYGSHLMLAGSAENGLVAHIAYSEFFNCGQPRIIGRYCIHFHMNGDVSGSFVRGNAVHDSMARVVTLHGVHYLTVQQNVGYRVQGHNFFVEDGIETNNLIQHNLAISSLQVWTMLQTDISVASFWITHPSNHFRNNHAAGSDFYGFWYEIKPHPDGPSATKDVCPMGNALGESHDNVAHSNVRFGLRIFKLTPRTYPCQPIFTTDQYDPWQDNPPVISTFYNYVLYKNGESGLLAEETGNLVFDNITSVQNKRAGAEFYVTQFTREPVKLINSVMVGQTLTNAPQDVSGSKGVITPRVGNLRLDNIRFYNYPANTHSLQTCSNCDNHLLFSNSAQEIYISNISFHNVSGKKLFMNGVKREILYDIDGSFTTTAFDGKQRKSATVTTSYKHLLADPACVPTTNLTAWDNTIICDQTVKVGRVTFTSAQPSSIYDLASFKAQQIPDTLTNVSQTSNNFSQIYSFFSATDHKDSMNDKKSWALPYLAGRLYNLWWLTGLDFTYLKMHSSQYLKESDLAVRFKFNYTLHRELYDIGANRPNYPLTANNLFFPEYAVLDPSICANGDYYHDDTVGQRTLEICASGKNRTYFETTQITAVTCRYLCPAEPGAFVKESFVRFWSNASQWPDARMPLPGENVTVNGNWTIIMDVDPAPCAFMQIDGEVIIQDKADRNITCDAIWIKAGSLTAGSPSAPFTHQLTIQLNGLKDHSGYTFDPTLQGSKIMVVTGKLQLYGIYPTSVSTRLTQTAQSGGTELTVDNAGGWAVNDQIVIAPSFSDSNQYERVQITGIADNTITFTPALKFTHYGSGSVTINNTIGQLDTRAAVGHVTRNIKFVSGPESGWGYTIVDYQIWEGATSSVGTLALSGVEFTLGGQYDTQAASINLQNNKDATAATTIVQYSSFSYCRSFCIKAEWHTNANITHNVFYEGRKFHIKLNDITNFYVAGNTMMGAIFRPTISGKEATACIEVTNSDPSSFGSAITNNVCQGSNMNGYVFPLLPCSLIANNPFSNNLAGSAQGNGYLLNRVISDGCVGFSGVRAYACTVGQIANPPGTTQLQYSDYILADNLRGLSLRFGLAGTDRSAILSNSYITAISRPNCSICYGSRSTKCSWAQAVRLLSVTVNGQSYPMSFSPNYDQLCKEETLDSKAYLYNVAFDNYKLDYSAMGLPCSNNVLFKDNPLATDLIGSAYLWNSTCSNCDFDAISYFDPPIAAHLGWFGGCGNMLCTGRNNYLLQDHTGTLFPQAGVILANNSWIGGNTPNCTYRPLMNGYYCTRSDLAVLEYESIAPDHNTRIMWPVSLTFGNWTTLTNGYREWEWMGSEPLNKRPARFISTLQLYQSYNMSFASNPPDDMRLQLQKRVQGGSDSDWAIFSIYYPFPNTIQVQVNGAVVQPITLLNSGPQNPLNTTLCGSNYFFYKNYTIQFVVTGDPSCLVRISLTNSIQLTLRFAMDINAFWSTNGPTRLVDRVCALFGIADQSTVKIASIYTGSTEVTLLFVIPVPPEANSTSYDNEQALIQAKELQATIDLALKSGDLGNQLLSNDGIGPLLSYDNLLVPLRQADSQAADTTPVNNNSSGSVIESNTGKIMLGVLIAVGLVVLITILLIIYLKRKSSNKVVDEIVPQFSQDVAGKSAKKEHEIQNVTEQNISEIVFEN